MSMCTKCLGDKKIATEYRIDIPHFAQCPQCFGTGIEPGSLSKEPLAPGSIVDEGDVPTWEELQAQAEAPYTEHDNKALRKQQRRDMFAAHAMNAMEMRSHTNFSHSDALECYAKADLMIAASGTDV